MTIGLATLGYLAPAGSGGGTPQIAPPMGDAQLGDFPPPVGMSATVDVRPAAPSLGAATDLNPAIPPVPPSPVGEAAVVDVRPPAPSGTARASDPAPPSGIATVV